MAIALNDKEKVREFIDSLSVDGVYKLLEHISHIDEKLIVNDQNKLNEFI